MAMKLLATSSSVAVYKSDDIASGNIYMGEYGRRYYAHGSTLLLAISPYVASCKQGICLLRLFPDM